MLYLLCKKREGGKRGKLCCIRLQKEWGKEEEKLHELCSIHFAIAVLEMKKDFVNMCPCSIGERVAQITTSM